LPSFDPEANVQHSVNIVRNIGESRREESSVNSLMNKLVSIPPDFVKEVDVVGGDSPSLQNVRSAEIYGGGGSMRLRMSLQQCWLLVSSGLIDLLKNGYPQDTHYSLEHCCVQSNG
jgi:hypothetical protein